jgi:hypothetical protein
MPHSAELRLHPGKESATVMFKVWGKNDVDFLVVLFFYFWRHSNVESKIRP